MHKRYQKQPGDESDEEAEDQPEDEDEESEETEDDPAEGEIPEDLKLSYENVSKWLRPMHALCYGSIQGCTMADKRILLLDTRAAEGRVRHFTLRHLIVGVSRATHQDNVHVANEDYEKRLMRDARQYGERPMAHGGDTFKYEEVDFDDINDLAMYFNDPDEVPGAELALCLNPVPAAPALEDPGQDADIADFFGDEGVFEDVEFDSDGDIVM